MPCRFAALATGDASLQVQVGSRADKTERVKVNITVSVVSTEYSDSECRVKGRCVSENAHVDLGSFHTITLTPQLPLTLSKKCWDRLDVARLEEASDPAASADLAIVLITDGLAHVCLLGRSITLIRAKVTSSSHLPRGTFPPLMATHAMFTGYLIAWRTDSIVMLMDFAACMALGVSRASLASAIIAGSLGRPSKELLVAMNCTTDGWAQQTETPPCNMPNKVTFSWFRCQL